MMTRICPMCGGRKAWEAINCHVCAGPLRRTPIELRFWAKVAKGALDECWLWQGAMGNGGYGIFGSRVDGCSSAHRYAWRLTNGAIPKGLCVCHKCDVRQCVNPAHLFLGTHKDNMRDCIAKGRQAKVNANKTHCKYGHEYTPENTGVDPKRGWRWCRFCFTPEGLRQKEARACLT